MENESELQEVEENIEHGVLATPDSVDKSTDEADEPKPVELVKVSIDGIEVEAPDGFKKGINKVHRRYKDEERARLALQRELDELKAKQTPDLSLTEIPEIPDSWDENYQTKVLERDVIIENNAKFSANEAIKAQREADILVSQQTRQVEEARNLEDKFFDHGKKLGVEKSKLDQALNVLGEYGSDPETANFVMSNPNGPLIAMFFANDLNAYDRFMSLPPMARGVEISNVIEKASAFKKQSSATPNPATGINGRTPPNTGSLKGMTFE